MEYVIFAIALFLLVAIFMVKGYYDYKQEEKRFIRKLYDEYGVLPQREYKPEQLAKISRYYEKHSEGFTIDDITWNDLNMDEVFVNMNFTYSAAGEEYLYYTLRKPCMQESTLAHQEDIIRYFSENTDERVAFQFIFSKLGRTGKFSIHDYLDYLDELGDRSNLKNYLSILLLVASVAMLFINISFGIIAFVCVLIYNNISYFKEKNDIDPYITSFSYIFRILDTIYKLQPHKASMLEDEFTILKKSSESLNNFRRGAFLLMSGSRMSGAGGNPLEFLLDFIRMGFHLDLIKFNQMLSEVRKHTTEIDDMITVLGQFETAIAIGEYRASLSYYCIPVFSQKIVLDADKMYHPLISNPIDNSIKTEKSVLITGSNASGKSTFLKTVAINSILAQTIHTCLAERFESSMFSVCSSMSLRDDVQGGSSYFMVEIKALKRILDTISENGQPVLCFVDEVLRGTNTVERIAASTQILKSLTGRKCICFAATHDIELTHLLEKDYTNYHFSEEIEDNDIFFSYKILDGRATTRNAIKLLGIMGYEPGIIHEAEKIASDFIQTGSWS